VELTYVLKVDYVVRNLRINFKTNPTPVNNPTMLA
jgi:hypothetical protein